MTSQSTNVVPLKQGQTVNDFRVPYGYELWRDGTYKVLDYEQLDKLPDQPDIHRDKPPSRTAAHVERICDDPVWLTQIARTFNAVAPEDEETLAEIACPHFHKPGEVRRKWVTKPDMLVHRRIEQLSAVGFSIGSSNATAMGTYFRAALRANKNHMKTILMGESVGMYDLSDHLDDVRGFLIGDQWITDQKYEGDLSKTLIFDPRHRSLTTRGLSTSGAESEWLRKFDELNALSPVVRWLNYTAFAPPLLKFVEGRTFLIHHWCRTGGGKTGLLRFALSAWGDPDALKATMNRTEKSFTEGFRSSTDILCGFDELQSAGQGLNLSTIIYTITNERSRGRAKAHGGLEAEFTWRTVARTTGEEPIIGADGSINLGGQTNRVIELKHESLPPKVAQDLHGWIEKNKHWGWAGPRFCRVVMELWRKNPLAVFNTQRHYLENVGCDYIELGERRIHLSTVAAAQEIFSQYIGGKSAEEARAYAEETMRAIADLLLMQGDPNETVGERGLRILLGSMIGNPGEWVFDTTERYPELVEGKIKTVLGLVNTRKDELWIVRERLEPFLRRNQVRPDVCFKEWRDDLKILKAPEKKQLTAKRQAGNFRGRFIVISWSESAQSPMNVDSGEPINPPKT